MTDRSAIYDRAGGHAAFVRLIDAFYARVETDEVLRPQYPDDLEPGKTALAQFLSQYWGGPTTYSEERGHPRLRMRHASFDITPDAALRWATHMTEAIREQGFDDEVEEQLLAYVVHATPQMINRAPDEVAGAGSLPTVPSVEVQGAAPRHMQAVTDIYGHYVATSTVTFDTVAKTEDEWVIVLAETHQADHHFLVATLGDDVVGYARTMQFRPKAGYRTTAEVSVYVAPEHVGKGIGDALYAELFRRLDGGPFHRAVAGIAGPEPASVALHERHGFQHVGTFREVGRKFDRLVDVAFYDRAL